MKIHPVSLFLKPMQGFSQRTIDVKLKSFFCINFNLEYQFNLIRN